MVTEETKKAGNFSKPSEKLWSASFVAIVIINFFNFFSFNLLTTGMPLYISYLGGSTLEIGLVISVVTASAIIVRPFTGVLLDRFGRRGIMIASLIYSTIIVAAYAVFPVVGLILGLRFLHGVGWGFAGTSTATVASDILPKSRFAEGMGFYAMANSVAVAIAPALSIELLNNFGAQPMIMVACASLLVACVLAMLIRFPAVSQKRESKKKLRLSDLYETTAFLPGILIVLVNMAFSAITTFIAVYGQGMGVSQISLYFVSYALTTIVTRPVLGRLIDRIGFFGPGIGATLGVVGTMVLISVSSNLAMFIVAGVLAGLGIGTSMSVFQTMAVSSVSPERRGVANSTYLFFFDLGICIGSLLSGLLVGICGYHMMYVLMALFPLISCVAIIAKGKTRINAYSVNVGK